MRSFVRIWSLRVHRHLGLVLAPVLLVFALSTLILNHPGESQTVDEPRVRTVSNLTVPDLDGLPLAQAVAAQAGVDGEVDWIQKRPAQAEVLVMMSKPTQRIEIRVDTRNRKARILTRKISALDRILYLHKRPGPHVASIRGNWWVLKIWRDVTDFSVVGVFLLSFTGIYLWIRLPGERRLGLVFAFLGIVALNVLLVLMLG